MMYAQHMQAPTNADSREQADPASSPLAVAHFYGDRYR